MGRFVGGVPYHDPARLERMLDERKRMIGVRSRASLLIHSVPVAARPRVPAALPAHPPPTGPPRSPRCRSMWQR